MNGYQILLNDEVSFTKETTNQLFDFHTPAGGASDRA